MFLQAGVSVCPSSSDSIVRRRGVHTGVPSSARGACWPRCPVSCADGSPTRPPARAIAGARIEIADRVEPARSDADGSFVVRGLEPKTYSVAVRAVGYAAFKRNVSIENGRTALLDAALDPVPTALAAVVSSARRTASEREAAAFDRAAIESSGKRDVGELLTTVPGVVVTRSGGPGQPTQVSIRGSSAAEVLVVVDGVVANSPLTGVADLSQLSLATDRTGHSLGRRTVGALRRTRACRRRRRRHAPSRARGIARARWRIVGRARGERLDRRRDRVRVPPQRDDLGGASNDARRLLV